ncbi:MAG: RNA-metabolising metallo-beta-lactamase [Parcubacteria group bacterium GW2011_GWA1_38_7]|nr:MAG: RNA-metabolising metallo-beta-lactamase [Parcubacteria group bacterium GW2011_GWA1_38_7]
MPEQKRNKIRSFYAPEKPRGLRNAPGVTPVRKRTDSFSRKRFVNSNSRFGHAENQKPQSVTTETLSLPVVGENIRIIPLGGVEEIGKNMTAIEIGDDILVIDAGFQFRDEDTPGVDYILPNTKYLEERKDKIRGVIITHGHLDHIGGIPYIMYRIGNPPIYSRALTTIMIKKRQEEFPHLPPLDIKVVEKEDTIILGKLRVKFFAVTHTIPDSMGIIIETPYGAIVTPGDIKLEHEKGIPTEREEAEYKIFEDKKVLLLMMDSTNVDNPGFSTPEKEVCKNLEEIIRGTKRRLIIGTFASQLERIIAIIEAAERNGKKVVVEGRSMKQNIEIVLSLGRLKVKKETIVGVEDIEKYPPDRVVVLATGAQGDEFAALMRMSNKSHKNIKVGKRDTVLLSSSIIPGNERSVQKLKDNLARLGAKIIHYRTSDVYIHSTGHGNRGELEWLHKKIKPKFFIPIHGNHYMLRIHEELAQTLGMPEKNIIVPDNGMIIQIEDQGEKIIALKQTAPSSPVMVDGFAVADVQEVVMRDRKMLADDGMFVIVAIIDLKTGRLRKSPDLISRGFVYLRESQELLGHTRLIIKKTIEESTRGMNPINFDYIKSNVTDAVARFLFQKTAKKPIVIPVILGV